MASSPSMCEEDVDGGALSGKGAKARGDKGMKTTRQRRARDVAGGLRPEALEGLAARVLDAAVRGTAGGRVVTCKWENRVGNM
jgi:hypothetical protein